MYQKLLFLSILFAGLMKSQTTNRMNLISDAVYYDGYAATCPYRSHQTIKYKIYKETYRH